MDYFFFFLEVTIRRTRPRKVFSFELFFFRIMISLRNHIFFGICFDILFITMNMVRDNLIESLNNHGARRVKTDSPIQMLNLNTELCQARLLEFDQPWYYENSHSRPVLIVAR